MEKELNIGRDVQMQILPQKLTEDPHIELYQIFKPAKEVGGDFYDVFMYEKNDEKKLVLTIADASGKGISACLYSLGVRSLLRGFGKEIPNLKKVVTLTNNYFCEEAADSGMFVTLFIGGYDPKSQFLEFFSCGHNPAVIIRSNGVVNIIENKGIALGLLKSFDYQGKTVKLNKGDILLLYTDGVTEAHNSKKELFGLKRLTLFSQNKNWLSAKEFVEKLMQELANFSGKAPQHDDITILAMRIVE